MLRKGITELLSIAFIVVIIITAIAIVLSVGMPAIERAKEAAILNEGRQNMVSLGSMVDEVASEGVGSLMSKQISVTDGEYRINGKANSIDFTFSSSGSYVQPGSFVKSGDITLSAGSNAKASEYDLNGDGSNDLVLENEIMRFGILKNGTAASESFINTSNIIRRINFKDTNANVTPSDSSIVIDGYPESSYGTGYSELVKQGDNMPKAEAVVHINSTFVVYDVLYTLQSGADFVTVKILNDYYK